MIDITKPIKSVSYNGQNIPLDGVASFPTLFGKIAAGIEIPEIVASDFNGITEIKDYASENLFQTIKGLKKITFGGDLTRLGYHTVYDVAGAYSSERMEEIVIEPSITFMNKRCIVGVEYIKRIIYRGNIPLKSLDDNNSGIIVDCGGTNMIGSPGYTLIIESDTLPSRFIKTSGNSNSIVGLKTLILNGTKGLNSTIDGGNDRIDSYSYDNIDGSGITKLEINTNATNFAIGNIARYVKDADDNYLGAEVIVKDGVKHLPVMRSGRINKINLPDSITDLDAWVFKSAYLPKIILPKNLKSIGDNCFESANSFNIYSPEIPEFDTIVIPASVTSIGYSAFMSSRILKFIFEGQCPDIESSTYAYTNPVLYDFRNCTRVPSLYSTDSLGYGANCQIVVPDALFEEWKTSTNWSALVTDSAQANYVVWVKASEYVEVTP